MFDKLKAESWNIAYRTLEQGTILNNRDDRFCVVKNPIRYWIADPFLFEKDNRTFIFAELFDYCSNKGVIGCAELKSTGITKWRVIISEKWHLSYPFIFEHNGEVYLMPEMNDGNELWIYKSKIFPYEWEKETVVLENVRLVDTSLQPFEDGYIAFSQDINQKPVAFRLDENLSFVTNVSYKGNNGEFVRPGGNFLLIDEKLFAVCQDCSKTYGGSLIFYSADVSKNMIELSNEQLHLYPEDVNLDVNIEKKGVHTYNATKRYEIIDIKTRRFSLLNLVGRILLHIRRK